MRRNAVLAACVLVLVATPVWADFYRWVDRDGKEFFTNDMKQVPQEYRSTVTVVKPDESRVVTESRPSAPGDRRAGAPHKDKYGRGEEYWSKRAANIRLKLRDQQDELALVRNRIDEQEKKPKKPNSKNKTLASLEKKKTKLEKDIAKTRRRLEVDLPEEARKADAYPGWIRE